MVFRFAGLILLLSWLTANSAIAQTKKENTYIQAVMGGAVVENLLQQGNTERALEIAQEHLTALQKLGSWDGYIQIQNIVSRGHLQSSDLTRLAETIRSSLGLIERYPVSALTRAGTHFIAGAGYLSLGQVDSSIYHLRISQTTFDTITDPFPIDHLPDSLSFVRNTFYPRIMRQMYVVQRPTVLGKVYNYLGLAYLATLDTRRAELMFERAKFFFQESGATPLEFSAAINRGQAIIQQRAGQEEAKLYERARTAFAEALVLAQNAPPAFTNFYQGVANRYLAVTAMIYERYTEATERYAEAVVLFQSVEDGELERLFRVPAPFIRISLATEHLRAEILAESNLSASTNVGWLDSLDRLETQFETVEAAYGQIDQELAFGVKIALARTRLSLQDWDGAHRMLRSLLELLANEPVAYNNPRQLPSFSELPEARILDTKLFIAIAEAFDRQYQATKELPLRRLSYQYYQLASERLARNRTYHLGYAGGNFSSELALGRAEVYNSGVTRQLFRTGLGLPEVGAADLLAYAEAGKAVVLRNVIDGLDAFNQLPQRVRERERFYRSELSRNQAFLRRISADSIGGTLAAEQWLRSQREYEQFVDSLRVDYPAYYQLRYATDLFDLDRFRSESAEENTLYLEYVLVPDERRLYLVWFDREASGIAETRLPENFSEQIARHIRLGAVPYPERNRELLTQYLTQSHELFELLLGPVRARLDEVERLVIVPDGDLHQVDFSYLLSEPTEMSVAAFAELPDYAGLPLLIHKVATQYVNTFSTLELLQQRNLSGSKREGVRYGAFEPLFGQSEADSLLTVVATDTLYEEKRLGRLNSIEKISELIASSDRTWKDEKATKANFLAALQRYRFGILHISTHGVLHPVDPLASFLLWQFQPDAEETRARLTVRELYNLSIEADLVLVNSCNSGNSSAESIGGEGLLSTGRGFFYAGCPSLILGRWSMTSRATNLLTKSLISELQEKESISQALRSAKLDYLRNQDVGPFDKSPFFWAALSHWGKDAVLFP